VLIMRYSVLLIALLICLGAACSPRGKRSLVGKWQTPQGSTVEFRANGTVAFAKDGRTREARYRLPSPTQIDFLAPNQDQVYDRWEVLSLSSTSLRVKNSKGTEQTLTRVP
jgi:hypothetical protein